VRNGAPRSVAKGCRGMTNEATPAILLLSPYNCIIILKIKILSAFISTYTITLHFNLKFKRVNTFFNLRDLILR